MEQFDLLNKDLLVDADERFSNSVGSEVEYSNKTGNDKKMQISPELIEAGLGTATTVISAAQNKNPDKAKIISVCGRKGLFPSAKKKLAYQKCVDKVMGYGGVEQTTLSTYTPPVYYNPNKSASTGGGSKKTVIIVLGVVGGLAVLGTAAYLIMRSRNK